MVLIDSLSIVLFERQTEIDNNIIANSLSVGYRERIDQNKDYHAVESVSMVVGLRNNTKAFIVIENASLSLLRGESKFIRVK